MHNPLIDEVPSPTSPKGKERRDTILQYVTRPGRRMSIEVLPLLGILAAFALGMLILAFTDPTTDRALLTREEYIGLNAVQSTCQILSLMGSVGVVGHQTQLWLNRGRRGAWNPIVWMSSFDILAGVGTLLSTVGLVKSVTVDTPAGPLVSLARDGWCVTQGVLIQLGAHGFVHASYYSAIAAYIHFYERESTNRRHHRLLLLLSLGTPLLTICLCLAFGSFGPAGYYCWIATTHPKTRVGVAYLPMWGIFFTSLTFFLPRTTRTPRVTLWVVCTLPVLWVGPTVSVVLEFVFRSRWWVFAHYWHTTWALQGAVVALVYGIKEFRRIQLERLGGGDLELGFITETLSSDHRQLAKHAIATMRGGGATDDASSPVVPYHPAGAPSGEVQTEHTRKRKFLVNGMWLSVAVLVSLNFSIGVSHSYWELETIQPLVLLVAYSIYLVLQSSVRPTRRMVKYDHTTYPLRYEPVKLWETEVGAEDYMKWVGLFNLCRTGSDVEGLYMVVEQHCALLRYNTMYHTLHHHLRVPLVVGYDFLHTAPQPDINGVTEVMRISWRDDADRRAILRDGRRNRNLDDLRDALHDAGRLRRSVSPQGLKKLQDLLLTTHPMLLFHWDRHIRRQMNLPAEEGMPRQASTMDILENVATLDTNAAAVMAHMLLHSRMRVFWKVLFRSLSSICALVVAWTPLMMMEDVEPVWLAELHLLYLASGFFYYRFLQHMLRGAASFYERRWVHEFLLCTLDRDVAAAKSMPYIPLIDRAVPAPQLKLNVVNFHRLRELVLGWNTAESTKDRHAIMVTAGLCGLMAIVTLMIVGYGVIAKHEFRLDALQASLMVCWGSASCYLLIILWLGQQATFLQGLFAAKFSRLAAELHGSLVLEPDPELDELVHLLRSFALTYDVEVPRTRLFNSAPLTPALFWKLAGLVLTALGGVSSLYFTSAVQSQV